MAFVKSYSNYVIQKKHQLTNQGVVFERDFSTIGGFGDNFNSDSRYYRQGTFVYGINNETIIPKLYSKNIWESNSNGDFWTKDTISNNSNLGESLNLTLKQDIYKLKDFAYYGSCVELVRSSINDIVNRFPGEIYAFNAQVVDSNDNVLDKDFPFLVDNPFGIDIFTPQENISVEEQSNLKFLLPNKNNYVFIDGSKTLEIDTITIEPNVREYDTDESLNAISETKKYECYPTSGVVVTIIPKQPQSSKLQLKIKCVYDENGSLTYLTNEQGSGKHIRPKEKFYNEFIDSLDSFQKVLLNKNSKPQYSAIFELLRETENGYHIFYEKFTFPVSHGSYNLDISSSAYKSYINSLANHSAFLDELFCNNLYRQMTHESIKNFDWTEELGRDNETKEDYVENGEKIQKLLYLIGREFDEIKCYIDNIKNSNNITYNDSNNLMDYFLTDSLNIDGWDVKNVFPFEITDSSFVEDLNLKCKPYSVKNYKSCKDVVQNPQGYLCGYWGDDCTQSKNTNLTENFVIDSKGYTRNRIKQYINDKEYSMQELNNKFMKLLKLNSKGILRKKGTIEAIEMLLSLFGLKSKRWVESLTEEARNRIDENISTYDYEIKEYVTIAKPIKEIENADPTYPICTHLYDFFNSTKNFTYSTYEYINNIYVPYRGLPVRYYDIDEKTRWLYPYFNKDVELDGKPYYQMNGGWLNKKYYLNNTNLTIQNSGYEDTVSQIPSVNDLKELLNLNDNTKLFNGSIYHVQDLKGEFILANGEIIDVQYGVTNDTRRYFTRQVNDGTITIGDQSWYGEIFTLDENGEEIRVDLSTVQDGSYATFYINTDNTILIAEDENILTNYIIVSDGYVLSIGEENTLIDEIPTNYFVLNDKNWKNIYGFLGWNQLYENSPEYLTMKKLKRNYSGNNPHSNGFMYDNGLEYLLYFHQLFKYAIEENAFKENCYSDSKEYMSSLEKIFEIGFDNILKSSEECPMDINLKEDKKIHHFCNTIDSNGETSYFYEHTEPIIESANTYCFYDKEEYMDLINDEGLKVDGGNDCKTAGVTCLDQIVNVKNIDIIFKGYKLNNIDVEDNEIIKQCKYLDEIILHYLTQVIPSNVILNIKFE